MFFIDSSYILYLVLYNAPSPLRSVYTSMAIIYGKVTENGIIDDVNEKGLLIEHPWP